MKAIYSASLTAATFVLLMISVPAHASSADDGIESSARKCYVFKTYLKDDDIKIQSKDGAVTLTGTVAEEPNKTLAQETVASLPGVKSVDNQLKLKDEPGAGSPDALVRARVKLDLLSHRNLSADKTDVQVKNGIVTLSGEAANQAQIDLTTEYIRDVEGVKDVKNDMTVSEANRTAGKKTMSEKAGAVGKKIGDTAGDVGEWIDDASITALVKATLLYHRSTSGLNTKVETIEGVVNLSGTAKNASEKDLATKFVQDVYGVKSVNNRMAIE
ncbi:MAG: BON domain-containing protein [Deltaproteobacteria bacterium]|nr:BON domain-containing protein [Deltaproteobacteria bacterium]